METTELNFEEWLNLPESDSGSQPVDVTPVYSHQIENAGASNLRLTQEQLTHTPIHPPSPTQSASLPFDSAPRLVDAVADTRPFSSEFNSVDGLFWAPGAPVLVPHQVLSSFGIGNTDFSLPATSDTCPTPPTDHIYARSFFREVAWDEAAAEAEYFQYDNTYSWNDVSSGNWGNVAVANGPPLFGVSTVRAQPVSMGPHTPLSSIPFTLSSPESSGASAGSSPESPPASIPPSQAVSRERRMRRSAPEPATLIVLRKCVRRFIEENPNDLEPSIGDPTAMAILGSRSGLGIYRRSIYSLFFSSRAGRPPFTCYECGSVEKRFSRALRHQRQEHFLHYPFRCEGGPGHPACGQSFASDEYVKDHVKKAGPTTFPCHICPKDFPNSGNLGRHLRLVHHI